MNTKDSKQPVIIHVEASHCASGERGKKNNCIIAVAAKDQTKGFVKDVRVGVRFTTFILSSGDRIRYSTPHKTSVQLQSFDRGGAALPPGSYTFNPPRKSETVEYQRKMSAKYAKPGYVKKRKNKHTKRCVTRKVVYSRINAEIQPAIVSTPPCTV